jgi:hypothetical protein
MLDGKVVAVPRNFPLQIGNRQSKIENSFGVLGQLVERLKERRFTQDARKTEELAASVRRRPHTYSNGSPS